MMFEIIGWVGTFSILLAYFLVSTKRVSADDVKYQFLNLIGAIGVIINSGIHKAAPSVGLNIVWLLIALYGLVKFVKK